MKRISIKDKKNNENCRVFLETPITDKDNDNFGAITYSEQIYFAIKKGAKFIAIDGEYGTGKSSIINLFENKVCNNKKNKRNNIFLNINFLNINNNKDIINGKNVTNVNQEQEERLIINNEYEKNTNVIDKYHRYFVNQVGSCLCKNPYDVERTFYNNQFSYTTTSLKKNNIFKKIIDKILVALIGFVSIYLVYSGFFKSITMFNDLYKIASNIMPYVLFIIFILLILYGYGFYKPEKVEKSPMLDIDKCKSNLCKVLYNNVPKNGNVYFIIDDLDRIDKKLQLPIISLLYNEYYHLDNVLSNIKIRFIFMIDLNKIIDDKESDINPDKLFDYILNVANNQPIIMRSYIEKQIDQNEILSYIFNKVENRDFIIGIINNNYNSIRRVKHLFNRIITKYVYLKDKNFKNINYSQLIIISVLMGFDCVGSLNKKLNGFINEGKQLTDSSMDLIIKEKKKKNMLDNNYYIYLTNFMDINNILNASEQIIYNVSNDPFSGLDDWESVYKILEKEEVNFSKIYNQIYRYLPNNEKILLLGDQKFYEYVKKNYKLDIDTKDFYKNFNISIKFQNYLKYSYFLDNETIFQSLDNLYFEYINKGNSENSQELNKFLTEVKTLIINLKNNIKNYDLTKYLDNILVPKDIFDLLLKQKEDNISVIYKMLIDKKINWDSIKPFIDINIVNDICKINDEKLKLELENYILQNDFDLDLKKHIILNENNSFENLESVYNDFNSNANFNLSEHDLQIILDKYGYNTLIDKYIIEALNVKSSEKNMIEYLKNKEYDLSLSVLDKIDSLQTKYEYSDYYEKLFKEKEYYELLLYSKTINNKKMSIDSSMSGNSKYIDAIINIYKQMENSFNKYAFSKGITNKIVDNFDFSNIDYNKDNFWKIDILVPSLKKYTKCINLFNRLKDCNVLNDYISHCKNNEINDKDFLANMRSYAQEMRLSTGIKSNITKLRKKAKTIN